MKSENCTAVAQNVKDILHPNGLDHVISNAAVGYQLTTTFEELLVLRFFYISFLFRSMVVHALMWF